MEMLRETFFMKGFIAAIAIAVLTKIIVWVNYHRLLVSSEEMDRPKRYWIGTLKKKIENYYTLQTKVNNISCIVDKYFEADKILGINSFFLEQIPGFCAIICVGLGCLGAIRGIAMNADINFWGRNLIVGVVCGIVIFMIDYLTKMDHMKRKIKINLINYLENILPNRMLNNMKKQNYKENLENKKKEEVKKEKLGYNIKSFKINENKIPINERRTNMDYKNLANLVFPDAKDISYYEEKYPERNLPEGAVVTRFAPSPTGFVHIGGLYQALVAREIAHKTVGVFFLRVEDTDQKREIENGVTGIVNSLQDFDMSPDEGMISDTKELGKYGPYKQSQRKDIYQAYAKYLISIGKAYPCFCSPEELEEIRNKQEVAKVRTGYYGVWAKCRNLSIEEMAERKKKDKSRNNKYNDIT